MPYNPNSPSYQTSQSRVMSFNDFEQRKGEEKEELAQMKRNFKKRGEMHDAPGETKNKWNKVTNKIDHLSHEEVEDNLEALEEKHHHGIKHYMFFKNLKTLHRLTHKMLEMNKHQIDQMLHEHDWASDHVATSKDDIEEVFNWIMGSKN